MSNPPIGLQDILGIYGNKSADDTYSSIGINIPAPVFQQSQYDDQAEDNNWTYIGNLAKMFSSPFMYGAGRRNLDRLQAMGEVIPQMGQRLGTLIPEVFTTAIEPIINATFGPVGIDEEELTTPTTEEKHSASLSQFTRGALKVFLESPGTFLTGLKIEGTELVPASTEEQAQGGLDLLGNVAMLGTYSKLATLGEVAMSPTIRFGAETSKAYRLGNLARNMSLEIGATGASGVAFEAISNPEDFSFDTITNNFANPVVLALGAGMGALRSSAVTRRAGTAWLNESVAINSDALIATPSAKQVAISSVSTLPEAAAAVDALTISDNWIQAGLNKVKEANRGLFYLTGVSAEESANIAKKYASTSKLKVKPLVENPGAPTKTKTGIELRFQDNFDAVLYNTDDLVALGAQYDIPVNTLEKMKKNLVNNIRRSATETVRGVDGPVLKFKTIRPNPLPEVAEGLNIYRARNGVFLASPIPLEAKAVSMFERTGILPKEEVLVGGSRATFEGIEANGKLRFRTSNKIVVKIDQKNYDTMVTRVPNGGMTTWNRRAFTEFQVDNFLSWAQKQDPKITFDSLLSRWGGMNKWDPAIDLPTFENYVYKVMEERATTAAGSFARDIVPVASDIDVYQRALEALTGKAEAMQQIALDKLNDLGYRLSPSGGGYNVITQDGKILAKFDTLDDAAKYARTDFAGANIQNLNTTNMPLGGVPTISNTQNKFLRLIESAKASRIGQLYRRPDRMAADIARRAGNAVLGVEVASLVDKMMNGIDAASAGIYKPLIERASKVQDLAKKVSVQGLEQVTTALEHLSIDEQVRTMEQGAVIYAEQFAQLAKDAGGLEAVRRAYTAVFLEGKDAFGKAVKLKDYPAKMQAALTELHTSVGNGKIADERILRLVDSIESGKNLTRQELIDSFKWDQATKDLFAESESFFKDASTRFSLPRTITGYAPWIQKWDSIPSIYTKVAGQTEFIHDLNRLGLTEQNTRVRRVNDLVQKYLKTGIHNQAPIAGGGTAGELLSQINTKIREIGELGTADVRVDVRPLEKWVANIRGVPDIESAIELNHAKFLEGITNKVKRGTGVDTIMDLVSLVKLGFRPILAARDMVSAYSVGSLYGIDTANSIFNWSERQIRRIDAASAAGKLPQYSNDAMLSRMGTSKIGKLTDVAMNLSFQPQVYKRISGNVYLHTLDKSLKILREAKGDMNYVIEKMGPLLDANERAAQEYFLHTAVRDIETAAEFIATRNAYNVANKFGRLNNPVAWQGGYGRIYGQFGSWGLNATTVAAEAIANSRNKYSAISKVGTVGAISGAVALGGAAAGFNLYNWFLNPLTTIPTPGPVIDMSSKLVRAAGLMTSFNEKDRRYAARLLDEAGLSVTVYNDMMKAEKYWNQQRDFFMASMVALGFKPLE